MPTPVNKKLYAEVKKIADEKFLAPTSIYKSAWIVKEYKRRGGIYQDDNEKKGLTQWFKEKWVDLERPIKDKKGKVVGYEECGRKSSYVNNKNVKYPVCRPSIRVNATTPKTVNEIAKKQIEKAKESKQKVKHTGRVKF